MSCSVSPQSPPPDLLVAERHILFRDFECRSKIDLTKVGASRYINDPSTEILCCGFAVDDDPVQLWVAGQPTPEVWATAADNPDWVVVAHNDGFESALERRFEWPSPPLARHICTAAMARAASLPGSLAGAAEACDLRIQKDLAGAKLMKQIAGLKIEPSPEQLATLYEYCRRDIDVLRALYNVLPPLPPDEHALWVVDQEINRRGFHADKRFARAMRDISLKRQSEIRDELAEITGNAVTSPDGPSAQKWLRARGLEIPKTFDKKAKFKILAGTKDPLVRRVLELVIEGSLKSAAKAKALLASINDDGRIRDTLLFCGATGAEQDSSPRT
jgi:DNA polymerase bacteriophage-type